MRKIFVVADYFVPGFNAGGPQRSISNLTTSLSDRFSFCIFTRDRDSGDSDPYPEITADQWCSINGCSVYYASPRGFRGSNLRSQIIQTAPDVLYLNSFFSTITIRCLLYRRFGLLPPVPVIVAPRGEFSPGALQQKSLKKRAFLIVGLRLLRLYDNVIWHATSELERRDIEVSLRVRGRIQVAANFPPADVARNVAHSVGNRLKQPGKCRFVYCSRISPKKNLHWLLPILKRLPGEIVLDIYGIRGDENYARICEREAANAPARIQINFHGPIANSQVLGRLACSHYFILPTLGENFGHAILESLLAGCPVIVSDRTPWRDLESQRVGWDLPLEDPGEWERVLRHCVHQEQAEYLQMSQAALDLAFRICEKPPLSETCELFEVV